MNSLNDMQTVLFTDEQMAEAREVKELILILLRDKSVTHIIGGLAMFMILEDLKNHDINFFAKEMNFLDC